jgi:hypothetical protein
MFVSVQLPALLSVVVNLVLISFGCRCVRSPRVLHKHFHYRRGAWLASNVDARKDHAHGDGVADHKADAKLLPGSLFPLKTVDKFLSVVRHREISR